MNDRVVASLRFGGVQLELMALAWKRSHSISSGLAFAVAVVPCIACRPRGQRISSRPLPNRITAKSHVSSGFV
jgi:hypothetical protein